MIKFKAFVFNINYRFKLKCFKIKTLTIYYSKALKTYIYDSLYTNDESFLIK